MANKSKRNISTKAQPLTPVQFFRRTIHSNRNMRKGLARARTIVKPTYFPMIVRELSRNAIYDSIIAPMAFPMSLASVLPGARLQEISIEGELLWTSSVLSLYANRLSNFVILRDKYYFAHENANYDLATSILDDIQKEFGFSIWLIENRLQLLQITKGLEAQKTWVEEILSTEGINQLIAWVTYFLSVRTEENVSYSSFVSELSEILEHGWLRDYAKLHFLPSECASIDDPNLPISMEEPHPIIDRFETFVAMALVYCTKVDVSGRAALIASLEQLEAINDSLIERMLAVLRENYSAIDSKFLALADAYTEGRYEILMADNCEGLELIARSHAYLSHPPVQDDKQSLRKQLIGHMYNISVLTPDATLSRVKLKKLAISCPSRATALEVAAFLDRTHDHLDVVSPSRLEIAASLSRPLDNPWSAAAIDSRRNNSNWLNFLAETNKNSSAVRLRLALVNRDATAVELNEMHFPAYRKAMYLGHINFACEKYEEAAECYLLAAKSDIYFVSQQAKHALFKTYHAAGKLQEAVHLAVDQVLLFPSGAISYPLETLASEYLNCQSANNSIDLAILLHMAMRHCNAKFERDLSNIYENIMEANSLERPSMFNDHINELSADRLIYFLRYICVPRILDDTTCFDSVEEIDQERIAVCQLLLTLDPQNIEIYQAEIRLVTRDNEVAALLSKMQTSKIYVDEAGIREALETSLAEPLTRYLKLLESPNLAYQAEKLSKRISEMLRSKGHPEFKDLKLPATEREGLFNAMLLEAGAEFALNPAYGLDTHVSTSIRHGAFEGHLRRALVIEDLLCARKNKEYILPAIWERKLPSLNEQEFDALQKLLGRFTQRFEELLHEYLKGKLHIRIIGDNVAMFNFVGCPGEVQSLMESITPSSTVQDLAERLITHFWELTTKSLDAIRLDLLTYAAKQMSSAFDALVRGVESRFTHATIAPIIDGVARARTTFQTAVEDVADWFQRPTDLSRDPFDIEVATHVSLQQIANCYVGNPIRSSLNICVNEKIDGRMLDGLCEIFFILLQNVIRHSGISDDKADVSISIQRDCESLILHCTSNLSSDVSIDDRRVCATDAMNRYERDSAMKMARKEGGSGLSKVWRIAEFDLRVQHSIELAVSDDHKFIVKLSLGGVWA